MKFQIILSTFLLSSLALANPFDNFLGEYQVVGKPSIINENASFCDRFSFSDLIQLEVFADTNGYNQTHKILFKIRNGWSAHPISEFWNELEPNIFSYAKTTGSSTVASNEWGHQNIDQLNKLIITLAISGSTYRIEMEELSLNAERSVCKYSANLKKNQ